MDIKQLTTNTNNGKVLSKTEAIYLKNTNQPNFEKN